MSQLKGVKASSEVIREGKVADLDGRDTGLPLASKMARTLAALGSVGFVGMLTRCQPPFRILRPA